MSAETQHTSVEQEIYLLSAHINIFLFYWYYWW